MAHTQSPNNIIFMDRQQNVDVEASMLSSPSSPSPYPSKKIRTPSPKRSCHSAVLGFKLSNLILTLAIGVIIVIEIKIMYETTRTYNESLVNQLSKKNDMLERTLVNLTASHNDRNVLLERLLTLNEEFRVESLNRSGRLEDKIDEAQQLITQLATENKAMYATGEQNYMDTLKVVREALTMNTDSVINVTDEHNEIKDKFKVLEQTVASNQQQQQRRRSSSWSMTNSASIGTPAFVILICLLATRSM